MLRLLFKRLFIVIPELFIISVICFFLMQHLQSDFDIQDPENTKTFSRYKPDVDRLIPSFYFSIVPYIFPDTLFKMPEPHLKKRIKDFLFNGYEWNSIQEYLTAEYHLERVINVNDHDFASTVHQFSTIAELSSADHMIEDSIKNTTEYKNWKKTIQELESTENNWKIFIPKVRYHGLHNQYHHWIKNFISGESGNSKIDNRPVWSKIGEALSWTFTLSLISIFLIFVLGYFIGEKLFLIKNKLVSKTLDAVLFLFDSLPVFFLGMLLIYIFASSTVSSALHIFPTPGFIDIQSGNSVFKSIAVYFSSLILPILCIVLPSLAYLSRVVSRKINDEYKKPYSYAAWAGGKSDKEIVKSEIRKNSVLPLISLLGMEIPALISGTVLIEILFNIPGMGRLTYQSIVLQDWPIVFHILLITALLTIAGKLFADFLIFFFDQRIKPGTK